MPIARDLAIYELEKLYKLVTAPITEVPTSTCCECGEVLRACSGPGTPSPGDFSLCFGCGCLNVFGDDLALRRPTDEEIFMAAADRDLQTLRRGIERFIASRKAEES